MSNKHRAVPIEPTVDMISEGFWLLRPEERPNETIGQIRAQAIDIYKGMVRAAPPAQLAETPGIEEFRLALELCRAALAEYSHRVGTSRYDWNADPDYMTRLSGRAFAAADALIGHYVPTQKNG